MVTTYIFYLQFQMTDALFAFKFGCFSRGYLEGKRISGNFFLGGSINEPVFYVQPADSYQHHFPARCTKLSSADLQRLFE